MIHIICRKYRIKNGFKYSDIGEANTLCQFECGRSTNYKHFLKYLEHAKKTNTLDSLFKLLKEAEHE